MSRLSVLAAALAPALVTACSEAPSSPTEVAALHAEWEAAYDALMEPVDGVVPPRRPSLISRRAGQLDFVLAVGPNIGNLRSLAQERPIVEVEFAEEGGGEVIGESSLPAPAVPAAMDPLEADPFDAIERWGQIVVAAYREGMESVALARTALRTDAEDRLEQAALRLDGAAVRAAGAPAPDGLDADPGSEAVVEGLAAELDNAFVPVLFRRAELTALRQALPLVRAELERLRGLEPSAGPGGDPGNDGPSSTGPDRGASNPDEGASNADHAAWRDEVEVCERLADLIAAEIEGKEAVLAGLQGRTADAAARLREESIARRRRRTAALAGR